MKNLKNTFLTLAACSVLGLMSATALAQYHDDRGGHGGGHGNAHGGHGGRTVVVNHHSYGHHPAPRVVYANHYHHYPRYYNNYPVIVYNGHHGYWSHRNGIKIFIRL